MIKSCLAIAAAFSFTTLVMAQMPPGGPTMEQVNTTLPEEGAPKAESGRYAVSNELAFGNDNLRVFRPVELTRFPKKDRLPVVVWGNGGCAMNVGRTAGLLETISSHGFLVITTNAGTGAPRSAAADNLKVGIDWAEKENTRTGSPLAGKIDIAHVAVMGQSCGGRLSIEVGADPRVDTIVVFNAGLNPEQMNLLEKLHGPVALINGHERDFMMAPSRATYDAIARLPAFYGSRHGAGHTATAYHQGGGEFANVASNWVRWQFKRDRTAAKMFVGKRCGLCTNENWDAESKRLRK